ncbi:hypothetical protein C8Q80DRAFT_1275652 [Daedaleopsis nitida]|nr:hypothetical protein C8Q80DRAFT_1275652 [Daedaleopsis nitida]
MAGVTVMSDASLVDAHANPVVTNVGTLSRAEKQKRRRLLWFDKKVKKGEKHPTEKVADTITAAGVLPTTVQGWSGKDFNQRAYDGKMLQKIASVPVWMTENDNRLLDEVEAACQDYIKKCGSLSDKIVGSNRRGFHWFMIVGVDRQIKAKPRLTAFHGAHAGDSDALIDDPNGPIRRVINHAAKCFKQRFPALADRVLACEESLKRMGYGEDVARPRYGYWYNFCINGPCGKVRGVMTRPHVDAKNLALMMCAVFVYGRFNSKEKAWLVLWEAGLIIEIPPGVVILYPSSLFMHFNISITDIDFVTTVDGSRPTRKNAHPLNEVPGRGSMVLFNQASLFQLAELGTTIKAAKAAKKSTKADNSRLIRGLRV